MILNYTSTTEQSGGASMSDWIAILQKNSKSSAQLQEEMIQGVSQTIKDIQDKAIEKAKESLKEAEDNSSDDAAVEYSSENGTLTETQSVSEDTQSTIDVKA